MDVKPEETSPANSTSVLVRMTREQTLGPRRRQLGLLEGSWEYFNEKSKT